MDVKSRPQYEDVPKTDLVRDPRASPTPKPLAAQLHLETPEDALRRPYSGFHQLLTWLRRRSRS